MRALILSGGRTVQGPSLLSDKRTYAATDGQTVFEVNYEGANVDAYVNGFRLAPNDYVATDGVSVSLVLACEAGDIVTLCGGAVDIVPDAYSKSEMDSMLVGKAASSHTHATSQVTGLDDALAGKAALLATSSVDGGIRMRLVGTTLYITNDGTDA
ncbi:MAG: hypothetical protein RBR82_15825 [Pseudomonas sp.]|nr:hypothetical protein [Pseudomonas sp.]